ncbi:GGDEF domain-containing protein [Vibrio rhodolitus]|uniref:GGDEF domain-containing protein n=1 Tax=Vibrio rhodolitus TaxID=2231649 RepID=UPI000E0BF2FE|nr:GGDEF domain-containing protein [Vibrio rhodolitus]
MSDFYLLYQPKMNDNVIVGLEALLRPVNVMQSIPDYLTGVTDTVALDLMVMKLCLQDVEQYDIKIPVSINIHPTSLLNDDFVTSAIKQLKDRHIILELVEHQDVDLNGTFLNSVSLLKQNNIQISIDDFGKDFARTDLALTIGADEVKFDRSLVHDIEVNYSKFRHLSFLYSKITTLCTRKVVFEGVENVRQKELIELFAESPVIQGFYFFRPMLLEEIVKLDGFVNHAPETYLEDSQRVGLDLDYKLYNFLVENGTCSLTDEAVNRFIEQNDVLGLVHNQDIKVTLKNLRDIYFNSSTIIGNGVMSLIDSTEKLVIIRNEHGVVTYDNAAHRELVGTSIVGIDPQDIISENESYRLCLEKDKYILIDDDLMFHKDKEFFDGVEYDTIREKMIYNDKKFIITTVCPSNVGLMDVSKDELTKCYTRSFLKYQLNSYEDRIVAFLDMNGFKAVNDTFGHRVGDACLVDFACLLKTSLREKDLVIRYGGDEFVIVFDSSSYDDIENRLNSLNAKMTSYFDKKGYDLSFAYGLAKVSNHDIHAAIEVADTNMYAAKRQIKRQRSVDFVI